jgi:hypothetical protein
MARLAKRRSETRRVRALEIDLLAAEILPPPHTGVAESIGPLLLSAAGVLIGSTVGIVSIFIVWVAKILVF